MKILQRKARKIVKKLIENNFQKVNVKSGKCRYNFRCQYNAVHEALNNNEDYIAMLWMVDSGCPIIHFVNCYIGIEADYNTISANKPIKRYTDNTIGRWSETVDYYLIQLIHKDDFFTIDDRFDEYRDEVNTWLPFWLRYFIGKNSF